MHEEDEDADMPQIGQITKNDKEDRKSMMKSILKEIPLRSNKDMSKEATEMFTKLHDVERLHGLGDFCQGRSIFSLVVRRAMSSQPGRHERSLNKNVIGPDRSHTVETDRIKPLD